MSRCQESLAVGKKDTKGGGTALTPVRPQCGVCYTSNRITGWIEVKILSDSHIGIVREHRRRALTEGSWHRHAQESDTSPS